MTEPLNIGMPTSSFLPSIGGAEVGLHNIATRLTARGHHPVVMVPTPHMRALKKVSWDLPYPVVAFPPKVWGILLRWPGLGLRILDSAFARVDRSHHIDVWHGTIGYPVGTALAHYGRKYGRPNLVRCAGEDIQINAEIGYGMRLDARVDAQVRRWLPNADRLVAITDSVAEEYHALGISDEHIAHIPNGVDLKRFNTTPDRSAVRKAYGISPDDFLFLCVGRNHAKKNFPALIEAFARISRPGAQLALVGQGAEELADLSRKLGGSDRVHLIETVYGGGVSKDRLKLPSDGLVALYRSADAFVFPSSLETFGIVLVEAMAAGLPVITTDAPGCRDVVRADVDGLTVATHDIDALATAMRRIHDDTDLRNRLIAAGHARAAAFSWDTITDSYISLYRELIADRARDVHEAVA